MADCIRRAQIINRITYELGHDELVNAILAWVADRHNGIFNDDTAVELKGDRIVITTDYAQLEPVPPKAAPEQEQDDG